MSPHAHALAEQLADDDHLATVGIPTAALAAEEGMGVRDYLAFRHDLLTSIGAGIDELRHAGWTLRVEQRTDPEQLPDGCERLVIVEAESWPKAEAA